jgi:cystinosin
VKYVPQAWLNYQRKSTAGWSIEQILLDVLGGILSMMQLGIDASVQHNWRDVIDNPVKLGLANISIFFDLIFITQHYLLYHQKGVRKESGEENDGQQPLLGTSTQVH